MNLSVVSNNRSFYADQDYALALKRIAELEKENKELKLKVKTVNALSRQKKK